MRHVRRFEARVEGLEEKVLLSVPGTGRPAGAVEVAAARVRRVQLAGTLAGTATLQAASGTTQPVDFSVSGKARPLGNVTAAGSLALTLGATGVPTAQPFQLTLNIGGNKPGTVVLSVTPASGAATASGLRVKYTIISGTGGAANVRGSGTIVVSGTLAAAGQPTPITLAFRPPVRGR